MSNHLAIWTALGLAAVSVSACRSDEAPVGKVRATAAWARATAPGQEVGGVFVTLRNDGEAGDRLIGGSTPMAEAVQIHTTQDEGGVARMRRQDSVAIPAGEQVDLAPGGTHLMLIELKAPLSTGSSFPLTLDFEHTPRRQVEVKVLPIGSEGPEDGGDE